MKPNEPMRQVAYVTMQNADARAAIVRTLESAGWAVIPQPTGFHLLQSIADIIDGEYTWLQPHMIVIDAYARGCAGTTIAAGLRELGITIPIVLIAAPGERLPVSPDRTLRIVTSSEAAAVVGELACVDGSRAYPLVGRRDVNARSNEAHVARGRSGARDRLCPSGVDYDST